MPHVVGLWEAMDKEESRAGAGFDAMDLHLGVDLYIEVFEPFEHFHLVLEEVGNKRRLGEIMAVFSICRST
jgi:hypothetical protein